MEVRLRRALDDQQRLLALAASLMDSIVNTANASCIMFLSMKPVNTHAQSVNISTDTRSTDHGKSHESGSIQGEIFPDCCAEATTVLSETGPEEPVVHAITCVRSMSN